MLHEWPFFLFLYILLRRRPQRSLWKISISISTLFAKKNEILYTTLSHTHNKPIRVCVSSARRFQTNRNLFDRTTVGCRWINAYRSVCHIHIYIYIYTIHHAWLASPLASFCRHLSRTRLKSIHATFAHRENTTIFRAPTTASPISHTETFKCYMLITLCLIYTCPMRCIDARVCYIIYIALALRWEIVKGICGKNYDYFVWSVFVGVYTSVVDV